MRPCRYKKDVEEGIAICFVWRVSDVLIKGAVMGIDLSIDEARKVLENISASHDMNTGINWGVIEMAILEVRNGR